MTLQIEDDYHDLQRRHPGAPMSVLLLDSCYTGHEDTFDPLEDEELPRGKRLPPREGWVTRAEAVKALGISSSKFRYMENAGYLPRARQIRNHVKMYMLVQVEGAYFVWKKSKPYGTETMLENCLEYITIMNTDRFR